MRHPVLDVHVHPLMTEAWRPAMTEYVRGANPSAYEQRARFADPSYLADFLTDQGVDHAVILAEEAPLTTGMVTSEAVLDFVAGQERLHCFVSLNPHLTPDLVRRLDQLMQVGEVKGIKLLPSYQQFDPAAPVMYPLYARAEELGLPITFHTGSSVIAGTRLRLAEPLLLDDVAVDFPDLTILLAHSGRGAWYEQAAVLATLHANVYLEISGLPPRNLRRYFPRLERLADKMVFGSDFPGLPSLAQNISDLRELFGDEAAHKVLWETGARLLGLTGPRTVTRESC